MTISKDSAGTLSELQHQAMSAASCGVAIIDFKEADLPVIYGNSAFYRLTGFSKDVVPSMSQLLQREESHPRGVHAIREGIHATSNAELTFKVSRKDGFQHWVRVTFAALPSETGSICHLVGTFSDETQHRLAVQNLNSERKEVENRLIERSQALERINQDLEGFTFSVSHDLRAPLRAIMGFSRVLVEDYGKAVDKDMRQTLHRINSAASRMSTIIEELLTFSRLGRKEMIRKKIDLSEVAKSICADLTRRHPDIHLTIQIEENLWVDGDPTLIRIALENLLDNAFKFTSKAENGRIELQRVEERCFVVRDNGAGFDARFSDKLFRPFERLHSASDYPGTGIGLANVQRIIERHGGKVWAEGKPNEGASFYFTI